MRRRPGWTSCFVDLPRDLDAALRARCAATGTRVSSEIRLAIARHLAYPPPPAPELAPLPTVTAKRGRPKKKME